MKQSSGCKNSLGCDDDNGIGASMFNSVIFGDQILPGHHNPVAYLPHGVLIPAKS